MSKIILGIDPGTIVLGFAVLDTEPLSLIKASSFKAPNKSIEYRLSVLYDFVLSLIKEFSPEAIATESQFVKKYIRSAMHLGMARAIVMLAAAQNDIPFFEYPPKLVKKSLTGQGGASKGQVSIMCNRLFKTDERDEDANDAIAIAITHCFRMRSKICTTT